jgi:hypothetical protein
LNQQQAEEVYDATLIQTLSKDEDYDIYVVYYQDLGIWTFEVYVDGAFKEDFTPTYKATDADDMTFIFGDDTDSGPNQGAGAAVWDDFYVYGHQSSRLYDNFEDGNPNNWRIFKTDTVYTEWKTVDDNDNGGYNLYLEQTETGQGNGHCYGQSLPIDYDPTESYKISFDFKPANDGDTYTVMSNREITIIYDQGDLMIVLSDENTETIQALTPGTWYFIEISRHDQAPNDYCDIFVNHVWKKTLWSHDGGFTDHDNGVIFVEFGDFGSDDLCRGAYWDDIRLFSDTEVGDAGFSDTFVDDENFLIFMADVEDGDAEADEWFFIEVAGSNLWEDSAATSWDGYAGDKIFETDPMANYPISTKCRLVTPSIDLSYLETATLSFAIVYDTPAVAGVPNNWQDGCRLQYRLWDTTEEEWDSWTLLGDAQSGFYDSGWCAAFSGPDAWMGDSSGWISKSISLSSLCGDGDSTEIVQFAFYFASDNVNTAARGIGIDDLKIFGDPYDDNGDEVADWDDDDVYNEDEYYTFKCSPFDTDSDSDEISDNDEVTDSDLTKWYEDDEDPADPARKDLFIEIDYLNIDSESMLTTDMRDYLMFNTEGSFQNRDIQIHVTYQSIDVSGDDWDTIGFTELEDLKEDHFTESHEGTWHYCLVVKYITNHDYQWAWQGGSRAVYAVSGQDCIDYGSDEDEVFAQYFQQGIGRNLGLNRHNSDKTYTPYDPTDNSMTQQVVKSNSFLDEDSDTVFTWQSLEYTFGGWEYSCDFMATPNEWNTGLFFASIARYDV